jgi:2-hydroxychromene-2-carboxylate isomerase
VTTADDRPVFLYDLASPLCWVAAEDVGGWAVWQPVSLLELNPDAHAALGDVDRDVIAQRAPMPLRWPDPYPADSVQAMLAAAFAKKSGRAVAFSLAAFRQAFAAGRDLGVPDNVLIAAAACEMHPSAVLKAGELRSVADRLTAATELARARGVRDVPAIWSPDGEVFHGDDALEQAAARLAA